MTGQEGRYVYVVRPDNTVENRLVTLGPSVWKAPPPLPGVTVPSWTLVNPNPAPSEANKPPAPAPRPVKSMVAITAGLKPDDRVIVEGIQRGGRPYLSLRKSGTYTPLEPGDCPWTQVLCFRERSRMISRFFIDRPIFANVIAIVTLLFGVVALYRLPVERYPQITPPTVHGRAPTIPGANATDVAEYGRRPHRAADQRRGEHDVHVLHQFRRRLLQPDHHLRDRHQPRRRHRSWCRTG